MTIKEAKAIDMVAYLSVMGIEPAKVRGNNYWYHSPFRSERTPSFKVNRSRNQWYDFQEGKGGNLLDLVLMLEKTTIPEALNKLASSSSVSAPKYHPKNPQSEPSIEIISVHPITSLALIQYCRERRIATQIMDEWLKEIRYKNAGKVYYALGFKNDAGGYELRSKYFKGSSKPKAPTLVKSETDELVVFEGCFDFLSYLTIRQGQALPKQDYLILNSTSFFEKQLPIMQVYKSVHLFLDNDATGNKFTELALSIDKNKFIDQRKLFDSYKDINEWIQRIGKSQDRDRER